MQSGSFIPELSRASQNADVGLEFIVGFGAVLDVEGVAERFPSHVARFQHSLRAMDGKWRRGAIKRQSC